jgi:RNA polymerase sigma-70 factor, ECF subfamily
VRNPDRPLTAIRALRPVPPPRIDEAATTAQSLEDVYRLYCRYVAAVCFRISGRRAELEDLTQEVFAEAAASFDALREPEAVRGWLATIAVRVTRKRLFRLRLYTWVGLAPAVDYEEIADPSASPYDRALIATVYRALDPLAPDDRIAFVLHHVEGETLESVARLTKCSVTTAKRRIFRARTALERRLSDDEH